MCNIKPTLYYYDFYILLNSRGYAAVSTTTKGKIFFYDCVASIRYIL